MQALILADDLTGAADCGVQAARRGLRTTVSLRGVPARGADVLAIDLDTREGSGPRDRRSRQPAGRAARGRTHGRRGAGTRAGVTGM